MRALALRSAEGAKQTSALISEALQKAQLSATTTETVRVRIADIRTEVGKITVTGEVAAASQQQRRGINEIGVAMNRLNDATQSTAAASEEAAAAAAEELSAQAEELRSLTATFRLRSLVVESGPAARPPGATPRSPRLAIQY